MGQAVAVADRDSSFAYQARVGTVEENKRRDGIEEDDGRRSRVSRQAARGKVPEGRRDGHGWREEFVVYVAGVGGARRHDSSGSIDSVARGHEILWRNQQ